MWLLVCERQRSDCSCGGVGEVAARVGGGGLEHVCNKLGDVRCWYRFDSVAFGLTELYKNRARVT